MMKKLKAGLQAKKTLMVFLIINFIFANAAMGGEKEHLELAFALVERTELSKMVIELAEVFMEPYFESHEPTPTDKTSINPLKKVFKEEVDLGEEELKWMLAGIYAKHLTENELLEIVRFFCSPAGSAWLEKSVATRTESEQIGLEWGKLLTQRVMQKFKALQSE